MKPLYVKKNGVVYKISGTGIPSIYPAANVEYDNTVTSELQATDVQDAIDELSTRQGGVQSNWTENDTSDLSYIQNKPENLVQDANYVHTDNNYDATAKGKVDSLGTASTKDVGVANGVAELDSAGKVPSSQLPSFVDDVIEVADYDHLPITGESGKIYVTLDTNKTYRWTGSGYVEISKSLGLGETSSTAYRGDRGKTAYDHATETKLSTATASGLYKVAATAQGHIASLTAVTKEDITGLGIPGQDTNTKNTAYGTCDTAGDVKDKVATLVNATNWSLEVGTIVGIRFTYTNTYIPSSGNNVTLNVNNTGAKNIRYSDGIVTSSTTDAKNPTAFGEAGQTIYYMYDGTYWVWVSHSKDNDTLYNFKGNEFRSADGNNYGQETGYGGNANYMVVNGHYYYNSNGPSTDIGASANDGAIYVQAYDEDNVTQIAQNYETGNIFVRSKVNGSWTEWKKTIANITANNTVLTTDKTLFLTRQTLNPTGFSGYVREKLVGASYAWNQLVQNGNFADSSGWSATNGVLTASGNVGTLTRNTATGNCFILRAVEKVTGHKYAFTITLKNNVGTNTILFRWYKNGTSGDQYMLVAATELTNSYTTFTGIISSDATSTTGALIIYNTTTTNGNAIDIKEVQLVDLTLAFGSTIADYLYSLTNNGGITKLRDMGCPIDKYTPYGYGLYSVKTSGKKIVGKNLCEDVIANCAIDSSGLIYASTSTKMGVARVLQGKTYVVKSDDNTLIAGLFYTKPTVGSTTYSGTRIVGASGDYSFTSPITGWIAFRSSSSYQYLQCEFGSTSTTYEPYSPITYPLGNDELRGKFDLVNGEIVASGDVKESNGVLTRMFGETAFSTLNWGYSSSSKRYEAPLPSNAKNIGTGRFADFVCSNYTPDTSAAVGDTGKCFISSTNIYVYDPNQSGTPTGSCNYPLATPTTEQSTPFADPMSLVGATTEEYIDTRDIPCPVGAERQYMGQSEDVIEIPSSPQSDGKRILISEVSGGKEQVYWDSLTKLNYHDYTVKGDGTTTWGDLLNSLRPIYESLSEDEKTFSKLIFRPESISGNECLSYCGAYWYSRMGLNSVNNALWIDHASLGPNSGLTYYYQKQGDTFIDKTSQTTTYSLSLRVFVEVGSSS